MILRLPRSVFVTLLLVFFTSNYGRKSMRTLTQNLEADKSTQLPTKVDKFYATRMFQQNGGIDMLN
jgi:hypothetical protein